MSPTTMRTGERLRAVAEELASLRTELQIMDEQIAFQSEVSEDARIRALVSETPLADREAAEARRDLDRMQRVREELAARAAALRTEQDELLERMLAERPAADQ